jgi:hypothetical protein
MVDYKEFYAKTKGDFFRMSKEADKYFTRSDGGFALFWINSPSPHKTLSVEYSPGDYPALTVTVRARWKGTIDIKLYEKDTAWSEAKQSW